MKKLKLQMQLSLDGFCGGSNGELDWMTCNWDDELKSYAADLTNSFDTIILGRKMTDGFISHWTDIVKNKPDHPDYEAAKIFIDTPKVVFTKTLKESKWANTILAKGDLKSEINNLKNMEGNDMPARQADIIVYGGAGFVSSLVKENLIDEYYLFINPSALGKGLSIFNSLDESKNLKLVNSKRFDCGIVVNHYQPN